MKLNTHLYCEIFGMAQSAAQKRPRYICAGQSWKVDLYHDIIVICIQSSLVQNNKLNLETHDPDRVLHI